MNNNNMLKQKTFKSSAIETPTRKKEKVIEKKVHFKNKKSKNNVQNKSINISILKIVSFILFIVFCFLNYHIMGLIGFDPENTLDYIDLVIVIVVGALYGVTTFLSQMEKEGGYIFKFLFSLLYSVGGDLLGVIFSFIICAILYLIVTIIGWFI